MKKTLILTFMVWLLILTAGTGAEGKTGTTGSRTDPVGRIGQFAQLLEKDHAEVSGWTVYAREEHSALLTKTQFERYVSKERNNFSTGNWTAFSKHGGILVRQARKRAGTGETAQLTYLAYPVGKLYRTATLYQVQSEKYNRNIWPVQEKKIHGEITEIFHRQVQIFSCVRAQDHARMKLGLSSRGDRYLNFFNAVPVERLSEKTFVSISAYNAIWNDQIRSGNRPVNLQVALRDDGQKTVITLGTPIITLEY
ncbi:YwmB family TATA-box binding protein [Sporolactobacillus vineae]|uniref:YwmB family TATA-box binding protein n=1 Tax=Sporolactobacillus vineae TaxID=444463 RepID=UPI0002889A89|nr:YwmB family TATA-box binding protein [Sporolactobacillus vineae]